MNTSRYPCPCRGYLVFRMHPGGSERCPICLWEDDLAQLRFPATAPCVATFLHPCRSPRLPGSANHVSLEDAQHNFVAFGSAERRRRGEGRSSYTDEAREQGWRALDPARDNIEEPQRGIDYGDSYPLSDTTVLYFWRATYWRRLVS